MYISSIAKSRMKNDRDASLALERAIKGVRGESKDTLEDIKAGLERLSWYSSCLFDKYQDVCNEVSSEDIRFIKSIKEIFKRKDFISDIVRIYIDIELDNLKGKNIQVLDKILTKTISQYHSGLVTKSTISSTLTFIIVNSYSFKQATISMINKSFFFILTAAAYYGKVQKAALCARRLRHLSPGLYQALYIKNLEMLYFIVSKKMDEALINSMGLKREEKLISIINTLTR